MTTQDQVNEIIATLGTDPEGVHANVRVRLDILEARINNPLAPAPNTTNPFYIDGYGGVSISVGDGYPTENRNNGSAYLRRDGAVTEGMYLRRSGAWELVGSGASSIHNNLAGLQGGTTAEYYHLTADGYTWLTDGYTTGYWSEVKGGTGQSTYATGDVLYASASNTLNKLSIGIASQVLTVSGGVPTWQTPVTGITNHNLLSNLQGGETDGYYHFTSSQHTWLTDGYADGYWAEDKGGTGQTTYSQGDLLYASSANTLSKLATGTAGQVLTVAVGSGLPYWANSVTKLSTTISTGKTGLLTANTDGYLLGNLSETNTEDMVVFIAPYDGTLSQLRIQAGTAPGGSETVSFTARIENVDSSLTATLSASNQTAADTSNTPSISAGEKVTLRFISSASSVASDISVFFFYSAT